MKVTSYILRYPVGLCFFYAVIALALIAPISSETYIPGLADYLNHLAGIVQAKLALLEGQFPIRIAPLEHSGWRYPLFQFYSPTTYTFAGLIYYWITPSNPLVAYKITVWFALVLGGIYMNRLAFLFIPSRIAALLASLVFLASPYYIVIINNLGDLSEIVALGLMPAAILYSLERYLHPFKNKTFLQVSLLWFLLLTTHIVVFIYTSLFVAIFLLMLTIKNRNHWYNLVRVGIAYGFGVILAAWYIIPVQLMVKYMTIHQTINDSTHFMSFKPMISQLLFSGGAQFQTNIIDNHPAIGWMILVGVAICTYAFVKKLRIHQHRADYWLPALLMLFYIAFIFAWSPFNFWKWFPDILLVGQYSWRYLEQVIWIGAILFSWAICWLFKNKLHQEHLIIGILLIMIASSTWYPTITRSKVDLDYFKEHPVLLYNQNSYTLNFIQHGKLAEKIDNMPLYLLMQNNVLQLNTTYELPNTLLELADHPFILMEGVIPDYFKKAHQLSFVVNDKIIQTKTLKPGKFDWNISLNEVIKQLNQPASLSIQFKINPDVDTKDKESSGILLSRLVTSGFLKPGEAFDAIAMQSHCQKKDTITTCNIDVPAKTTLLELPILYYPKLLQITLNGKPVNYYGVLYQDYLVAGIDSEPGKMNIIQIEFKGIKWANQLSLAAWLIWTMLLVSLLVNQSILRLKNRK